LAQLTLLGTPALCPYKLQDRGQRAGSRPNRFNDNGHSDPAATDACPLNNIVLVTNPDQDRIGNGTGRSQPDGL